MAYYSSSYYDVYNGEYCYNGEYSLTPCYSSYDSAPVQDSMAYSSYRFNDDQSFAHDSDLSYAAHDPVPSNYSGIAYSASTFGKPLYVEFDPAPYYHEETRFIVTHNVSEFNEPEFEEYDPTPYGGGYDPEQTYGKPLPPSDEICYPRSTSDPNALFSNGISYGSIPTAYGKDEGDIPKAKPQAENKPAPVIDAGPLPDEQGNGQGNSQEKPLDLQKDEESEEEYGGGGGGGAHCPSPRYSNGANGELGYDHEYGKQVPQIPSGYGLEATDICESLFGYWPCLSKYGRKDHDYQQVADHCGCYGNQWKGAADYLFGSSNPYGERRDDEGSYGNVIYGYQRSYQEQPLYHEVKYAEDSLPS